MEPSRIHRSAEEPKISESDAVLGVYVFGKKVRAKLSIRRKLGGISWLLWGEITR
jgi:hypothetical protein